MDWGVSCALLCRVVPCRDDLHLTALNTICCDMDIEALEGSLLDSSGFCGIIFGPSKSICTNDRSICGTESLPQFLVKLPSKDCAAENIFSRSNFEAFWRSLISAITSWFDEIVSNAWLMCSSKARLYVPDRFLITLMSGMQSSISCRNLVECPLLSIPSEHSRDSYSFVISPIGNDI